MATQESLIYFGRWLDIINLEQSTLNVSNGSSASTPDSNKKIKEEGMKITELRVIEGDDPVLATFDVILERPYTTYSKRNGDILQGSYINLHTQNSISFTKGLVLKKHLITKRQSALDRGEDGAQVDDDDDEEETKQITTSGPNTDPTSGGTSG